MRCLEVPLAYVRAGVVIRVNSVSLTCPVVLS